MTIKIELRRDNGNLIYQIEGNAFLPLKVPFFDPIVENRQALCQFKYSPEVEEYP